MGKATLGLVFFLIWIVCLALEIGSTVPAVTEFLLRGVAPPDENYYKGLLSSSSSIKCKDGSKKFTKSQFNDDFCDCPDASDEPGTSACPLGKFHCRNAGHVSISVHSSMVNDGICDCCDGSDEYDSKIKCHNTCWEAGKVARDRLLKKIATYQEGVTIRNRDVEKAKSSIIKDEAELQKLKSEEKILKGLVQQLKEHKEQIEKVEEKERLQREKEEKEMKEAEEASQKEQQAMQSTETIKGDHTKDDNNDRGETIIGEHVKGDNNDRDGVLEESPSKQDIIEDHDNQRNEAKHTADSSEDGSSKNVVEPVEEDSFEHVSKQDEESAISDKSVIAAENQDEDATENAESLSKEELGRLVASRWTGEKTDQQTDDMRITEEEKPENHEETPSDGHDEEYHEYEDANEEYNGSKYEDDDDDEDADVEADGDADADGEDPLENYDGEYHDDSSSFDGSESYDEPYLSGSKPTWLEKIQATVRSIFQVVNLFQSPIDKSEAARIRKEYDESNAKLSKLQSRISSLTQKLKHDFGPEKEFYSFYGQCFEGKENKYVYKICPYKQANQVEGHSTTRLGNWEKFEDSYTSMKFTSGDKCWNGPDRSLKVKLRCGLNNEVSDVDEPSRCEYEALFSTPALCREEKLKELETKLDMMNKEQPSSHDEL